MKKISFLKKNQDNEPIINNSQQVKEDNKEDTQEPGDQDLSFISELIYQDGKNLSYSQKQELKKLPEVVIWPKFSGVEEYDHEEVINRIDGKFVDFSKIPDYWITKRLNNSFRGH
ncbi:hypothetical protein O181_113878 [Austropuccinia psidii MF-1]|uniref:Uncharacterized protein n=1 Tax=Austropuccinia psidii MF-1 TaxID=1389203 RepID=A0A9Q3K3C0_9BASI|nr:hypothetical protein [Austropuccinia psidii MF-1]